MWDGILDALWLWYSVSVLLTHNNKRQDLTFRRDMECNTDIRHTFARLECKVHGVNFDIPHDVNFSIICLSDLTHIRKYPASILERQNTGQFISPCGISDLCGTVAGMVTPKGSMSTEGETPQLYVPPYRCSICPTLVTRQMSTL